MNAFTAPTSSTRTLTAPPAPGEPDPCPPPRLTPRGGAPLGVRFCKECGHPFYPARQDQDFCQKRCRQDFHHRRAARGVQALDAVMAWRKTRKKGGMTDVCHLADAWLAEDRTRAAAHKDLRLRFAEQQPAAQQKDIVR